MSRAIRLQRGQDVEMRDGYDKSDYAELLTVNDVAELLRCSHDHVRRIPKSKLAVYRAGKENLYFLVDVISYVRQHCQVGDGTDPGSERDDWVMAIADKVRGNRATAKRRRPLG